MTLEINTTRGLASSNFEASYLHIKSFHNAMPTVLCWQSKSPMIDLRRQDTKNRQNSIDDIDELSKQEFEIQIQSSTLMMA